MALLQIARRSKRTLLAALICCGALVVIWQQTDAAALRTAVAQISVVSAALALAMLTAGAFLASIRLRTITSDIGARLTLRDAALAMSLGQVAGALSVQVFGQIAARSAFLTRRGFTVPDNIAMALYERLVALAVSVSLAIAGAWFLFGHIVLDYEAGGWQFVYIVAGTTAATLSAAIFGWGRRAVTFVWPRLHRRLFWALAKLSLLTLVIQATTAFAYIVIARSLAPQVDLAQIVAASFVVMFAASLPISFAGWGVREISAIFALNFVGVPTSAALLTAVLVGLFSLIATVIVGSVAASTRAPDISIRNTASDMPGQAIDFGLLLSWIVPLATATAIFFQIYVPTGNGQINVNLADPLALFGGAIFVWSLMNRRYAYRWRISHLGLHAALGSAVIVFAFVRGWAMFGWTDWAFYNKLIGWFVLLAYFGCGALLVGAARLDGLKMLLRTFVASGVAVVAMALLAAGVLLIDHDYSNPTDYIALVGFAQNRNALAFQVLMLMAVALVAHRSRPLILLTLLFAFTIVLGSSRAAFGGLMVAALAYIYLVSGPMRVKLKLLVSIAVAVGTIVLILKLVSMSGNGISAFQPWTLSNNYDAAARWQSIVGGIDLFLRSPVLGAGLGAFMQSNGATLQIHSTPLWLLAEAGVIGFAVFAVPAIRLFVAAWRDARTDQAALVLVLILTAFAVMVSVHEMLYQRVFWLLLGAFALHSVNAPVHAKAEHAVASDARADGNAPAHSNQMNS